MPQGSFARRRRNVDARAHIVRQPPSYSRYTDPEIFPRFGGDEFDPPPYATDRRSTVAAPVTVGSRRGKPRDGLAMFGKVVWFVPQLLFRNLNTLFAVPR
jgi:hypothetical protein